MKPRILLLATVPPWPPTVGGQQRTNLLLRSLSEVGEVEVACVYSGEIPAEDLNETAEACNFLGHMKWEEIRFHWSQNMVRKLASWVGYPRSLELLRTRLLRDRFRYLPDPKLKQWLQDLHAERAYDLIVSRFLLPLCRTDASQFGPVILDVDDLASTHYETRMYQEGVPWHARLILKECARYCHAIQKRSFAHCQHLWFVSEEDRNSFSGRETSSVLPNIPFEPSVIPDFQACEEALDSQTILTVGSFRYEPNRHGVDWFLEKVWPHVREAQPAAKYQLVGQVGDNDASRWQAVPGVQVAGRVEELRPYYAESAFTVAPVLIGAGTKIKVLESLAYGRCCVVTPHSGYGYLQDFPEGAGLISAISESEMSELCIRYLRDPHQRTEMSKAGNERVSMKYSYTAFSSQVERTVADVLGRPAAQQPMVTGA